jgi:Uma2 family endonuclease
MTTTTQLMTAEELMQLEGPYRHELIKGELLTMPPPKSEHGRVAANLTVLLHLHVKPNKLGTVFNETGYKLESNPDTVLGPDVSFVSRERTGNDPNAYYQGPPDVAIEVLSPSDRRLRVEWKVDLWLSLGAKSVWLVNPKRRTVEVALANGTRALFHESDELVDDTVPGLRISVSEAFN